MFARNLPCVQSRRMTHLIDIATKILPRRQRAAFLAVSLVAVLAGCSSAEVPTASEEEALGAARSCTFDKQNCGDDGDSVACITPNATATTGVCTTAFHLCPCKDPKEVCRATSNG